MTDSFFIQLYFLLSLVVLAVTLWRGVRTIRKQEAFMGRNRTPLKGRRAVIYGIILIAFGFIFVGSTVYAMIIGRISTIGMSALVVAFSVTNLIAMSVANSSDNN
ncbi:MAG: hypothetical protein KF726_28100 [Anaerolineae bacterium]|nr:hypothetical protein [Anaerolineae bacterium]